MIVPNIMLTLLGLYGCYIILDIVQKQNLTYSNFETIDTLRRALYCVILSILGLSLSWMVQTC